MISAFRNWAPLPRRPPARLEQFQRAEQEKWERSTPRRRHQGGVEQGVDRRRSRSSASGSSGSRSSLLRQHAVRAFLCRGPSSRLLEPIIALTSRYSSRPNWHHLATVARALVSAHRRHGVARRAVQETRPREAARPPRGHAPDPSRTRSRRGRTVLPLAISMAFVLGVVGQYREHGPKISSCAIVIVRLDVREDRRLHEVAPGKTFRPAEVLRHTTARLRRCRPGCSFCTRSNCALLTTGPIVVAGSCGSPTRTFATRPSAAQELLLLLLRARGCGSARGTIARCWRTRARRSIGLRPSDRHRAG